VRDGKPLIYLDSAATTQRPRSVIDAVREFDLGSYAAVHRGAHALAEEATLAFEGARTSVAAFLGAEPGELVVTTGTTGAINTAAFAIESAGVGVGDLIVVTEAEHHSNLVPWQRLASRTGAELAWIPVGEDGRLDLGVVDDLAARRPRVVAVTGASNVTGACTDLAALGGVDWGPRAIRVLDAAQMPGHGVVCFRDLGFDLAAVSAHKMYGPTGVGALLGSQSVLEQLGPAWTGGSMVEMVTMTQATFQPPPQRFEAGTQPVSQMVGWAAAVRYLTAIGMDRIAAREAELTARLLEGVGGVAGVRVLGPLDTRDRSGVVSLDVSGVHPHDVGQFLDSLGIAVRVGHHCAQPVHRALGVHASTRVSLGLYSTKAEVDAVVKALAQVRPFFGVA